MDEIVILVIDDTQQVRDTFRALLESEGYVCHDAANGKEGLEKAIELEPDIILLDVMMPEMDGFEVCQRIRKTPSIAQIPVLMVTALDDKENTIKGLDSGADDFINKPVDRLIFLSRVKTISRLNRFRVLRENQRVVEGTLKGVVDLLVELITLTPNLRNDETIKLIGTVNYLIDKLKIDDSESLLHAANLMNIGQLMIPIDLIRKKEAGNKLAPSERAIFSDIKNISIKLLDKIPGFQKVQDIIAYNQITYAELKGAKYSRNSANFLGHLMFCAVEFNRLLDVGFSPKSAEIEMNKVADQFHPKIVSILTYFKPVIFQDDVLSVKVGELKVGMLCDDDIRGKNGTSILKKGEVINQANLERIMIFNRGIGVQEPICVRVIDR